MDLVAVGFIAGSDVASDFMMSVSALHAVDARHGRRLQHRHWLLHQRSGVNVASARNALTYRFLALTDPTPDWLLMVDADMCFDPGALESLLTEARPDRIVGGLCVALDTAGKPIATIYDQGDPVGGIPTFQPVPADDVPDESLREVYGTGAAFLLVHRAAFAAIAHCTPNPYPWFRELVLHDDDTTHWIGEDMFFCLQARRAGCRVFVHTGVHIEHVKPVRLTERLWREGVSL